VPGFEQLGHKVAADELRSSDNQAIHAEKFMGKAEPQTRLIVILESQMRN